MFSDYPDYPTTWWIWLSMNENTSPTGSRTSWNGQVGWRTLRDMESHPTGASERNSAFAAERASGFDSQVELWTTIGDVGSQDDCWLFPSHVHSWYRQQNMVNLMKPRLNMPQPWASLWSDTSFCSDGLAPELYKYGLSYVVLIHSGNGYIDQLVFHRLWERWINVVSCYPLSPARFIDQASTSINH